MPLLSHAMIIAQVALIPEGRVASYGQIAALCGFPRHARQVGYALATLPPDTRVPWHRVVNAKGEISLRRMPGGDEFQRLLLEDEGLRFDRSGRICLKRYQWQPDESDI
jgi:methylated-DNA-protein-cysteine methyltransferase-like protein